VGGVIGNYLSFSLEMKGIWKFTIKISPVHINHGMISFVVSKYRQVKGNRLMQSSKMRVQVMVAREFPSNG